MDVTAGMKNSGSDTGEFTPTHSDSDLLQFLESEGKAGTRTVADRFDYKQPTAYRRLRQLEQQGEVESERVGNALLWRVLKEGDSNQ